MFLFRMIAHFTREFRIPLALTVGFACALGAMAHFASKLAFRASVTEILAANVRTAAILEKSFTLALREGIAAAQSLSPGRQSEEVMSRSKWLMSVGQLAPNGADFTYVRRIDAPTVAAPALTHVLTDLHNEILNAGLRQEQLYVALMGDDEPVIVAIAPVSDVSAYVVLRAAPLFDLLRESTGGATAFVTDRFGTILLHPEQWRAIHRESASSLPLVKTALNGVATSAKFESPQSIGAFSRSGFGGAVAIAESPAELAQISANQVRNGLITRLVPLGLALIAISQLFISVTRYRRKRNGGEQLDLKIAA
jgi:hypothetical protein